MLTIESFMLTIENPVHAMNFLKFKCKICVLLLFKFQAFYNPKPTVYFLQLFSTFPHSKIHFCVGNFYKDITFYWKILSLHLKKFFPAVLESLGKKFFFYQPVYGM